jgi:GWxTD domain-containing protein
MQRKVFAALVCAFALATAAWCFQQRDKLQKELESPYDKWLKVDVAYIIMDAERKAFSRLSTDDEREQFVEQFWLRRDPTPDTLENEYKEEHYRRIAYANERFASGFPGWKTDRGMIYIKHGPPDEIESHPSGGTYPFERWRYRHLDGVGEDVVIEFVDQTMSGEYRMTTDPKDKDAFRYVPGSQQQAPPGVATPSLGRNEFDLIEQVSNLSKPPALKFKDLEASVSSSVRYNAFPVRVRTDFIPITPASILSYITLQVDRKDLRFQENDGVGWATVNVYGRVSTISRRTASVFEDVVRVERPSGSMRGATDGAALYQKMIPLAPGRYRLNIAVKDVVGGGMANYETALDVPRFDEDQLSASSLILADVLERVPVRSTGAGQFVIGDKKVRPRMNATFRSDERLGLYAQLYHLGRDAATGRPSGTIEYLIERSGSDKPALQYTEDLGGQVSASQVTVEKWLPLKTLGRGSYVVKLKVTDRKRGQTITPTATFTVE